MKINRCVYNPLLTPADVKPSDPRFQVDGVFNCGVARCGKEIILLCRVAESVRQREEGKIEIPIVVNEEGKDRIATVVYDAVRLFGQQIRFQKKAGGRKTYRKSHVPLPPARGAF